MPRKHLALLVAFGPLLAACAPTAQSIKPALVSESAYSGLDCASLDSGLASARAELVEKSAHQERINATDPANILFFELKIANALDKRNEKRIAELKGQIAAMEAQRAAKKCPGQPVN